MDWQLYLLINSDLRYNGVRSEMSALHHYKQYGEREGRIPSFEILFSRHGIDPIHFPVLTKFIRDWCEWEIFNNANKEKTIPYNVFHKIIGETEPRDGYELSFHMTIFDEEEMFDSTQYAEMYSDAPHVDNTAEHFHKMFRKENRHGSVLHKLVKVIRNYQHSFFSSYTRNLNLIRMRQLVDSKLPIDFDWKIFRQQQSTNYHFLRYLGRSMVVLYYIFLQFSNQNTYYPYYGYYRYKFLTPRTDQPVIHIVSAISVGGSKQYAKELSFFCHHHGFQTNFITNLSDFEKFDQYDSCDILWISHLLHTGIQLNHFIDLLHRQRFQKVICNFHDMSLFHYFDEKVLSVEHYHSHHHVPERISPKLEKFLDNVCMVLCPSKWLQNFVTERYPHPHRILYSPHCDISDNQRPLIKPIVTDSVNVCVPHEISYLKGDKLSRVIAPILNKFPHVKLYLYGNYTSRNFINAIPCGRYHGDEEFYDWLQRDNIHGFMLLNDHRETYSYCFSKCINAGLPCLYSDVEGAIGDRVREYNISGIYELKGSILEMKKKITEYIRVLQTGISSPAYNKNMITREMCLDVPPIYKGIVNMLDKMQNKFHCHKWVKPYAIYFPQYHRMLQNDVEYYPRMTDFESLFSMQKEITNDQYVSLIVGNNSKSTIPDSPIQRINYPTNCEFKSVPRAVEKQARLASRFGFQGFAIYHYWFSQNSVTNENATMYKVTNSFFKTDTQLPDNFKIFFIWANGDWSDSVRHAHQSIVNKYTQEDFIHHFKYLNPYFSNDVYLKENNRPVIFLHYSVALSVDELNLLKQTWHEEALKVGFDGIEIILNGIGDHFVNSSTHFVHQPDVNILNEIKEKNTPFSDTSFIVSMKRYGDKLEERYHHKLSQPIRSSDVEVVFPSFNASARYYRTDTIKMTNNFCTYDDGPDTFYKLCKGQLQYYHPSFAVRNEIEKIFLVNAWNEWGEDMKIEPSVQYGFNYLFAFSRSLQECKDW